MPGSKATGRASHRELTVEGNGVRLAGSLWLPRDEPLAVLLMHPGSGPSDRDNDVYFPPIRQHLLANGIGVSSFDKRGVGGSTGRWEDAAIEAQADDLLACLEALVADAAFDAPVGVYGHSQGGWVVVEAAGRAAPLAFVVTNSGPGVTPGEQERYAIRAYMTRAAIATTELGEVGRYFDRLVEMMREGVPFEEVRRRTADAGFADAVHELGLPVLPERAEEWELMAALLDYDPRPALERIRVPVLALFGAGDPIVPVEASVGVYREAVQPELLTVAVLPGSDHRLQAGDPPALVEGYLDTLSSFVASVVSARV